ncbi:MAG: aldehyde dehydrogenase family protein [Myxococcota bacterium]
MSLQTIGSVALPEAKSQIPPTTQDACDEALAVLRDKADTWAALDLTGRINLLDAINETTHAIAERWVQAGCAAKKIRRGTPDEAEEWLGGPAVFLRNIRLLRRSLVEIRDQGAPQLPGPVSTLPSGQVVAQVFPTDNLDKILFGGFTAEVWMDPELKKEELRDSMAVFYREAKPEGRVGLVLGAGNVSSIGPMDALYKLFAEGEVVILKMNPVNEYLGPIMEEALRPLVDAGYLRVVYGGATVGDYLCRHDHVDSIHITGSDKTHDAIVWGVGEEGQKAKERGEKRNERPITSELGNVSPIIVVPGPWNQKELEFQGVNLASSLTNNAGFNCNATRVIVNHKGWAQRRGLLDAVRQAFIQAEDRFPYYPGAEERQAQFVAAHPEAEQFGAMGEGRVPWTLIEGLDANAEDEICFNTEAWCGVTSEAVIEASDVVEYIEKAVEFANERCWGTLSASIIVHPKSLKDPRVQRAVDKAIEDLRFGSVIVNHWAALSYGFVSTCWGAFPGHTDEDIRSGRGVVHNTYLFDRPQKTVVRGPFTVFPKPAWFVTNKTAHEIGRKLTSLYYDGSLLRVPSLLFSALRG